MRLTLGRLDIQAGGMRIRCGPFWLPDGLHIWLGSRGVHLFWSASPYMRRVTFDRARPMNAGGGYGSTVDDLDSGDGSA